MGEWFKKNSIVCAVSSYVVAMVGLVGSTIYSTVKHEKREKAYYQKQNELLEIMIDDYRANTKKES